MNKEVHPLRQGDVILVPFPFTDLTATKTRPAVVVSKPGRGEDVIVCAVTSKSFRGGVKFTEVDLSMGKLPLTSYIRIEKVVALHVSLVRRVVASLSKKKLNELIRLFKAQF
ncbi:type II toxin-antitoxin system PemK/MazF family toxin [Candidatus Uhrbacteria bacterium]|nr:type II toxin-antitoxin system PemK/MazF family toxin [Candidatus Uhrbacteria bacterium]